MAIIKSDDFAQVMEEILPAGGLSAIALACSGGGDSMALAILLRDWAQDAGCEVNALIVDHRLRSESTTEAELVKSRLADIDIPAYILTRPKGEKPTSDIQNQARQIRYQLMADYCANKGIDYLALAHHQDDQAETFLLRLARGSGVDGLSAMQAISRYQKLTLLRPLLDYPKLDLIETVEATNTPYVNDPSNLDQKFDRVKMRMAEGQLAEIGLTNSRLAETAKTLSRARSALEEMTDEFLHKSCTIHKEGHVSLDLDMLCRTHAEIALRALSFLLKNIAGKKYPTRFSQLERLYNNLISDQLSGGCTLSGCGVRLKSGNVMIFRELESITDNLPISQKMTWDERFNLSFEDAKPDILIRKLGEIGWSQLRQTTDISCDLPAVIRNGLPTLWQGDKVLFVPHLQGIDQAQKWGMLDISTKLQENFSNHPFL